MKILYYFAETASYMQQWQRVHIFDELERGGHTVEVFNPLLFETLDRANETLLSRLKDGSLRCDLFMNCTSSKQLYNSSMQEINRLGIPSLLICFDNLHAPFIHREIAPYFDLVWLTSRETQPMFEQWNCNTIFLPYAANPHILTPDYGKEISSIGFIGRLYDDRVNRVNRLTANDIPCTLYSDAFSSSGSWKGGKSLTYKETVQLLVNLSTFAIGRKVAYGTIKNKLLSSGNQLIKSEFLQLEHSVPFEKMGEIYSNHALSLGISELRNTFVLKHPVHKMHLRTFEIPMCGGLQIAPYVEELAGYFEDGKEIVLCKSDDDFLSKAKFYLQPEKVQLRHQMKLNARKRAENEHTWMNRFDKIFSELFH
jgi:hypothetical protein